MRSKGVFSLAVTTILCLPSLLGGFALLLNLLWQRQLGEWGNGSAGSVAMGVFIGGPLVSLAACLGLLVAFRRTVSLQIKAAHLAVVVLGAVATICLLVRFAT